MAKILCSPSKYVQGAGEMKKLGEYAQKYGKKAGNCRWLRLQLQCASPFRRMA